LSLQLEQIWILDSLNTYKQETDATTKYLLEQPLLTFAFF
jgi:hypothetical protein